MKKLSIITLFFGLLVIAFGCSKSENNDSAYYFRAKVEATKVEALKHHASVVDGNLRIFGVWNDKEAIAFSVRDFTNSAGTFAVDYPNAINNQAKYHRDITSTDENQHFGTSNGELIITEITSKAIKGTFSFMAKNPNSEPVSITEGEFFLPLSNVWVNIVEEKAIDAIEKFKEVVPQSLVDDVTARGFEIHHGNNPPTIEGSFLSQPHILISPYAGDTYPQGHQWPKRTYTFYNQQDGKISINIKASDTTEGGHGFYVMGSGNKFTIFAQIEGVERGVKKRSITLISGEVSAEGVKNLKAAYTLTWKEGDSNNYILMPVGKSRISGDKDGLAKRVR